ncbi:MAG: acetyl-CoA C-acyltransferase [Janthinobacterium lividum]
MNALIVGYARTPFVRFTGSFAAVPATRLGSHALGAALRRAAVPSALVDRVVGGQVLQALSGQNPARQAAFGAGIPLTVPALTLNMVCLSGLEAVSQAAALIEAGLADVVVAVGMESMSCAPHAWSGSRAGARYGSVELLDTLERDGLSDAFEHRSMGASTEEGNGELGLGRVAQDGWSVRSHRRAATSRDFLAGEIEPYEIATRRSTTTVDIDDGVRDDTTQEGLARLRPAFHADGTITAGNSSPITDGAAAVVLMSESAVSRSGTTPVARVISTAVVAGPDVRLHRQPSNAIVAALRRADADVAALTRVEITEAFASVALASTEALGVDPDIVNVHGGAIALGHPIGASGARIVGTLARQLSAVGPGSLGAAGICGGGGQGAAVVLEAV